MPGAIDYDDPIFRRRVNPLDISEYFQITVEPAARFKIDTEEIVRDYFIFEDSDQIVSERFPDFLMIVHKKQ